MLEIEDLHVNYGGIRALRGISLRVPKGEIVTLIGANGAGKTTTLKAIMGLVHPTSGRIVFEGEEITAIDTDTIVSKGISLVPEGRHVFVNLTVRENLYMGAYQRSDREIESDIEWIFGMFPRLKERSTQKAGTLSGGEQQMLALGRALMARPRLLLLDEPSLGLAPLVVERVFSVIKEIFEGGTTILLIEQNAMAALELAHYGYVLETGRIGMEGEGRALLGDERVKKAYLGGI